MAGVATVGFVGGGNMAEAILKGLIARGQEPQSLIVGEPVAERRDSLKRQYGIEVTDDNVSVVETADVVVLAIKPQMVDTVVPGLAPTFTGDKILVSILAGTSTAALEAHLGGSARVVRVMPNTPALIGQGAAAICAGAHASENDLAVAHELFSTVGSVVRVTEEQMDAVTAVSGSGPAYIFTVIEAMTEGGVAEGLDRQTAFDLALQTVVGSAQLVAETGEEPMALRAKVCSPGGTTLAAIEKLDEGGFRETLVSGVRRAAARSRELGKS
jgi:pyrroline-5-carboxylate reductase